ncbi:phage terminase large subunit [Methylobacterium sp. E-065]|uniref:phage terminase large subunit n=1 Tax=Methylobacterium sp. E-065 TaxID=2836583 RepID=UPI001FB937EC|nr:phage terminase large subunit [Methylobacterium sp. E-065]MCJ2022351.1 phage terminase large subunit [Methylobacterium sp. E-065]
MSDQQRLLRALMRQHLAAFAQKTFHALEPGTPYCHSWHLDHLAWQLGRIADGEVRRLIINVPPRSMKSITVSVAFTAWLLGRDPTKRILCASYASDLARKHAIDTRHIMESDWYRELFPRCELVARRQRDTELVTTLRGGRLAFGLGGALTGRGADVIILDDPMKASSATSEADRRRAIEYYEGTLVSRLNNKRRGAIVLVMQRLHEADLCGHLVERAREDWEVVHLPAIAVEDGVFPLSSRPDHVHRRRCGEALQPDREPRDLLEGLRRELGSRTFEAQYQQTPVPAGGNLIRREWLRHYRERPVTFDRVVVSWDTASTLGETSDWSVGLVWGVRDQDFYLLDAVRQRVEFHQLRRAVLRLHERWNADVTLIERTALGHALLQDLRRTSPLRPILLPARLDKVARCEAQSARFEEGRVYLPAEAPWLGVYEAELLAFPNGRHDDQVDATSYALHYLTNWLRRVRPPARRSRESIRGETRTRQAPDVQAATAELAASVPAGAKERIEDGRRIIYVPASTPIPTPWEHEPPSGRTIRRSVRRRDGA